MIVRSFSVSLPRRRGGWSSWSTSVKVQAPVAGFSVKVKTVSPAGRRRQHCCRPPHRSAQRRPTSDAAPAASYPSAANKVSGSSAPDWNSAASAGRNRRRRRQRRRCRRQCRRPGRRPAMPSSNAVLVNRAGRHSGVAIGVSSSTVTTRPLALPVTVSPSKSVAWISAAQIDRQIVLGVVARQPFSVGWSSWSTSLNVHAPVVAFSVNVNTVLPAPAAAVSTLPTTA